MRTTGRSLPGAPALLAARHEPGLRLRQLRERPRDIVADGLDAGDALRVELRIVRAARRSAGDLEDRLEVVAVHLARLGILPAALPRQLPVLRPQAVRQRHRTDLVAGLRRVDAHRVTRD